MGQPPRKSHQTQAHVDYRNSDDYQEELYQRANAALPLTPKDEADNSGLDRLVRSGRRYVYDRTMEDSPNKSTKVAADNTRVTPRKNK